MNSNVKKRLYFFLVSIITTLVIGKFVFDSLKINSVYFFSPTDLKNINEIPNGLIRVGGMIKIKSLSKKGNQYSFIVTDFKNEIMVNYTGIKPNLFEEGQGAVVEGKLNTRTNLVATKILAKHDENYMPKEVADALKKTEETKIASFISTLWDIGLDVGHSVRKINECIDESNKDISTQTNLMESRFLIGSKLLHSSFIKVINQTLDGRKFLDAKMVELTQRHSRYNDSFQNLEPNLKESPGGLRDLQTILWIAQAAGYGSNWDSIRSNGIITKLEQAQLEKHERALIFVRTLLHVQAGRKEDRLLFDFQRLLAADLGFRTTSAKPAKATGNPMDRICEKGLSPDRNRMTM